MFETIIENFVKLRGFSPRKPTGAIKSGKPKVSRPTSPNKSKLTKPPPKNKPRNNDPDGPDQPQRPTNQPDSGGGGGFGGMNMSDMLSLAGVGLMAYSIFGMESPPEEPPLADEYVSTNEYSTGDDSTTGEENVSDEYSQLSNNEAYLKSKRPATSTSKKTDYSVYFKLFLFIAFILIITVLIYKYTNRNTNNNTEEES